MLEFGTCSMHLWRSLTVSAPNGHHCVCICTCTCVALSAQRMKMALTLLSIRARMTEKEEGRAPPIPKETSLRLPRQWSWFTTTVVGVSVPRLTPPPRTHTSPSCLWDTFASGISEIRYCVYSIKCKLNIVIFAHFSGKGCHMLHFLEILCFITINTV